ncbi:MAG: hypothetical protein UT39_C0003G0032 [Candidatus Woesebacteria bacterium GW2011_GWA1_39_21]|uniref:DUF2130 domain-containing protein n=1 Tax=Candidatus Woesebacteria bacterium GW2011_GWA1_39_21 TaxID=1618550 RepID=A0A0G0N8J3_9BACT|nr:MAG: hypothetical protein UT39_C0003G0032 [Candidatus Woesebacteria bacterium GW2011_GWA1_39_21]
MSGMANIIKCPHCNKTFELTDVLQHQIEEKLTADLFKKHQEELETVKKEAEQKIRKDLEEKTSLEMSDLQKQLSEKEEKVNEMRGNELKLREEKRKLQEKEKDLELETKRRIDDERKKIEESVLKQAVEEHRFQDLEKEQKIAALQKQLEEALRKSKVGSQQLQGEVLELDIEGLLRDSFPSDEVAPVAKGVKGADVRQIVKSPKGYAAGVILWEIKRTKAWTDSWTSKLKEDLRAETANIPVIVTTTLPKDIDSGFGLYDGVWVVSFNLVVPVATIIRKNLLDVLFEKAVSSHKGEKSEILYEYITSHEFQQQVEAIVEVYNEMKGQIEKEKAAFEKIWKAREGQMQRFISSTANVVGSIQGRIGQTALPIKGLELLEDGE